MVNEIDTKHPQKQCVVCRFRHNKCSDYPCTICKDPNGELIEFEWSDDLGTCSWCEDDYDLSELKRTDMGYLCSRCIDAILSRGEPLAIYHNEED